MSIYISVLRAIIILRNVSTIKTKELKNHSENVSNFIVKVDVLI